MIAGFDSELKIVISYFQLINISNQKITTNINTMKTLRIITVTVIISLLSITTSELLATASAESDSVSQVTQQNEEKLFDILERSAIYGLSSDVRGIVESTLYNVVDYKVKYPAFDSEILIQKISEIALEGENHSLRYKAYLALAYYKNQEVFGTQDELLSMLDYKNQDRVFFYLQDEVQSGQFTSNQ